MRLRAIDQRNRHLRRRVPLALALLALVAAGCGGGSSSDSTVAQASSEFLQPGNPNNKLVKFGSEAPPGVRSEASGVLTKNLDAREAADFVTQCATLDQKKLEEVSNDKGSKAIKACPKELRKLAEPLSESQPIRANQLSGQIAALRLKGNQAYALFHGDDSDDYAMPMYKEDGEWKVAAILLTKLGRN
jgi:hypothetical protein